MLTPNPNIVDWANKDSARWIVTVAKTIDRWSRLGVHSDAGGALSIGKANKKPNTFGRNWIHTVFLPFKKCKLLDVEIKTYRADDRCDEEWNSRLPEDLQEFLRFTNGAFFFEGHFIIGGYKSATFEYATSANYEPTLLDDLNLRGRPPFLPSDDIIVGLYPYSSTHILLREGSIVVGSVSPSRPKKIWSRFSDFLIDEMGRIDKLYRSDGTISDPDMVKPI